ncbi:MAG: glycosyltransferase, partial [Oscillospiraceae bacterium]|nr:glycosyltransferase [Oscillospiraceae bacterium]
RRVFELLACNTVVVSNYSRGLELFFGDLIIETNDREHMKDQLDKFCGTELGYRKYRLAGLRHVLSSHLYEDRLDRIAQKALGRSIKKPLPKILVVCCKENEKIRNMFDSQTYESKQLVVADNVTKLSDYQFDYVTIFSENDYYGKNYLTDFALATRFASDDVIGKCAYYSDGKVVNIEKAYMRVTEEIKLNRQMVAKAMFEDTTTLADLFAFNKAAEILSLDEFNYCENADSYDDADDIEIYTGIPIEEIYEYTDRIPPVELKKNKEISVKELYDELIIKDSDLVTKSFENGNMKLVREADDDKVVWLYTNKTYNVDDYAVNDHIGFYPESVDKTGIVRCQIEYYDENEIKLGFLNFVIDGFTLLYITNRAKSFKLIFRMRGKSSLTLKKMYSASSDHIFAAPLPVRKNLLITEIYPDYDDRENGRKLHEFAKENNLEVFKVGETLNYLPYSEYEGVQITSSRYSAIKEYINARDFDCIYVSSDSQKVKEYLADYKGRIVTI